MYNNKIWICVNYWLFKISYWLWLNKNRRRISSSSWRKIPSNSKWLQLPALLRLSYFNPLFDFFVSLLHIDIIRFIPIGIGSIYPTSFCSLFKLILLNTNYLNTQHLIFFTHFCVVVNHKKQELIIILTLRFNLFFCFDPNSKLIFILCMNVFRIYCHVSVVKIY